MLFANGVNPHEWWAKGEGEAMELSSTLQPLAAFKRDPANRGRVMDRGLWRYTRHPNYFGEVTLWWGLWLIVCGIPDGWMTLPGPLTITLLILKVSGIPMLERRYAGRADFEDYKRRTSVFLPLPPRERNTP